MQTPSQTPSTPTLPPAVAQALDALEAAGAAYVAATGGDPDAHDSEAGDAEIAAVGRAHTAVTDALIAAKCRAESAHTAAEHLVEVIYETGGGRVPQVAEAARHALAVLLALAGG